MARSPDGLQPLCAVWRTSMIEALEWALVEGGHPPVHQVLRSVRAVETPFENGAGFLNINSAQDLMEAERRLSGA